MVIRMLSILVFIASVVSLFFRSLKKLERNNLAVEFKNFYVKQKTKKSKKLQSQEKLHL